MKINPRKKTVKAQDTTKGKKPIRLDNTIKTKWKNPEITHWNKVAARQDSIGNLRLAEAKAKKDSLSDIRAGESGTPATRKLNKILTSNPPKHFVGAVLGGVGAVANIATSIHANNQAKKEAKRAAMESQRTALNQQRGQDMLEMDTYPEEGVGHVNYYQAAGGKIKEGGSHDTIGGKLNNLSSDMEIAKGNTHESSKIDNTSGIKLIQGNKAIAEIEDDETIKDGKLVYSDRLKASNGKTFADNAERLAKEKGKAEKRLGKGDSISKATSERKVGMIDQAENALFAEQEALKEKKGIKQNERVPKAAFGAVLGDVATHALPLVDNVANAFLTSKAPKAPKPTYLKPRKLNTDVNVNPQLNSIDNAVDSASRTVMNNTSNSNTARNTIASARLRGAEQKSRVLANKENQENRLENANTQFQMRTEAANAGKRDNFNAQNMARQGQMRSEISANISNMAGDFTTMINNKREEDFSDKQLAAFKTAYGKNGIVDRSDEELERMYRMIQLGRRNTIQGNAFGGKLKK